MAESTTPTAVLVEHHDTTDEQLHRLAGAFLAGFPSASTRRTYEQGLRQWFTFCRAHGIDPLAARRVHVELWLRHLEDTGRSSGTRAVRFTAIQSLYQWCIEEDITTYSPCARVRPPRPSKTPQPAMDQVELHRFVRAAKEDPPYFNAALLTILFCCLRVSAACNANVSDLSYDGWIAKLTVTEKGGKTLTKVVPPIAITAIEEALAGRTSGPLFLNSNGDRMRPNSITLAVNRVARRAGIDKHLSPHSLRRTAIQEAFRRDVAPRLIQEWAGHSKLETTVGYDTSAHSDTQSPGFVIMAAA